jgi:hypothetical protein
MLSTEGHAVAELEKKKGAPATGMAHFYRKLLEESEQKHEAAVAATQKPTIGPQGPAPNLTITRPLDLAPKSDLELARIAREQGREVELNDDNQIVDKRDLLAAGLNLSAPNTRRLGLRTSTAPSTSGTAQEIQSHRAVGTAASKQAINERRAREIVQQMEQEKDRIAHEKASAEELAVQRTIARRNTETDVESARERYLQRKRRKLEEAAAVEESNRNSINAGLQDTTIHLYS